MLAFVEKKACWLQITWPEAVSQRATLHRSVKTERYTAWVVDRPWNQQSIPYLALATIAAKHRLSHRDLFTLQSPEIS